MAIKIKRIFLILSIICAILKIDCFATSYNSYYAPDGSIVNNSYNLKDLVCVDQSGNPKEVNIGNLKYVYLKNNLYPIGFTLKARYGYNYLVLGNFIAKSNKAQFIYKDGSNYYCSKEIYEFIKSIQLCPQRIPSINRADNLSPNSSIVGYAKQAFPTATGSNINYGNLPDWIKKDSTKDYVLIYDRTGMGFVAWGYDIGQGNQVFTLSQLILNNPSDRSVLDLDKLIPQNYGLRYINNIPPVTKSSLMLKGATLLPNNSIDINTLAINNFPMILTNFQNDYSTIPPNGSRLFINGLAPQTTNNGNCFIPLSGNNIATLSYISVRNSTNNEDYASILIYGYELVTDNSGTVITDLGNIIYTIFPHNTNIEVARSITNLLQEAENIVSRTRSIIDVAIDNVKKYGGTTEFRAVITSKVGILIFMIIPILLLFGRSTILFIFSFWENNRLVKTLTSDAIPVIQVLSFGFHDYESLTSKSYLPEYVLNLTGAFLLFKGNILYIIKFISDMVRMLMNSF